MIGLERTRIAFPVPEGQSLDMTATQATQPNHTGSKETSRTMSGSGGRVRIGVTRIGIGKRLSEEARRMPKTTGVDGDRNGHTRPPLMDIEAVAQRLAVGVRHVRRLVTEKRIPYRKWGHLLRFEPDEIEAWIEASRVPATHAVASPAEVRTNGPNGNRAA